jgi:hypothetical protein
MFAAFFISMMMLFAAGVSAGKITQEPYTDWSQDKAVEIYPFSVRTPDTGSLRPHPADSVWV